MPQVKNNCLVSVLKQRGFGVNCTHKSLGSKNTTAYSCPCFRPSYNLSQDACNSRTFGMKRKQFLCVAFRMCLHDMFSSECLGAFDLFAFRCRYGVFVCICWPVNCNIMRESYIFLCCRKGYKSNLLGTIQRVPGPVLHFFYRARDKFGLMAEFQS